MLEEISASELAEKSRAALKITVDDGAKAAAVLRAEFSDLVFNTDKNTVNVSSDVKDVSAINEKLVNAGVRVYELKNESVSFEDFFIGRLGK